LGSELSACADVFARTFQWNRQAGSNQFSLSLVSLPAQTYGVGILWSFCYQCVFYWVSLISKPMLELNALEFPPQALDPEDNEELEQVYVAKKLDKLYAYLENLPFRREYCIKTAFNQIVADLVTYPLLYAATRAATTPLDLESSSKRIVDFTFGYSGLLSRIASTLWRTFASVITFSFFNAGISELRHSKPSTNVSKWVPCMAAATLFLLSYQFWYPLEVISVRERLLPAGTGYDITQGPTLLFQLWSTEGFGGLFSGRVAHLLCLVLSFYAASLGIPYYKSTAWF